MNKSIHPIHIVIRVYRQALEMIPLSAIMSWIFYLVEGLFPSLITYVSIRLLDAVQYTIVQHQGMDMVYRWGWILIGGFALKMVVQYVSNIAINAGVYEKLTAYSRIKLYEKISKLSFIHFEDAQFLDAKKRAEECFVGDEYLSQIYMSTSVFITSGLGVLSVMGVLAGFSLWFIPISVGTVLPYFIVRWIRGKEFYYIKHQQAKASRRMDYLYKLFTQRQTVKEMRVNGSDEYISHQWEATRDDVNETLWAHQKKDVRSLMMCDLIRIGGYGLSLALALLLAVRGDISAGVFGACIAAFLSMQRNMQTFLEDMGRLPEKIRFARHYFEILDMEEHNEGVEPFQQFHHCLRLSDVSFTYPNSETPAVNNVSLSVKRGEKIAIVGVNGSGKTTLTKLMLGIYPLNHGCVAVDHKDIGLYTLHDLYQHVSMVSQNFTQYNLSLRENAAIGDIQRMSDDAAIRKSLDDVGMAEHDLDQMMGRVFNGREFSGGQWQKIAIARALFKDSDIIILDEPTSALDPVVENEILSMFIQAAGDKTSIIISHRVGLCTMVDRVLVMDAGRIIEDGSHQDLMAKKGHYYQMYTRQAVWYQT